MLERFRAFLELAFRELAPTKESEDYKAELLGILMDRAEEMKKNGEADENVIYKTCIEKLGDFKENFVNFKKAAPAKTVVKKAFNGLLWGGIYMLVLVAIYLIVSFTAGPWSKTWLILVCGPLAALVGLFVYAAVIAGKRRRYGAMRSEIAVAITLSTVITYLCFSVLNPVSVWHVSWLLFLFLPILLTGVDLLINIITGSKLLNVSIMIFIMIGSTLLYIILGVTGFAAWHPCWLIPVVAFIIDIIIGVLSVRFKLFGKK